MTETGLVPFTPSPTPPATPRAGAPRPGSRRAPRPARPRAETTVSMAILTDRGLAEGYVALPLARLMASRVWASVETLNQHLAILEQNSFTRMTSDPTFEPQGKALQQLLRAYAVLTAQVADLAQRLAQNRLTEADRLVLATGHLGLLLPAALAAPALPPPAAEPEATSDADPAPTPDATAALERPADLPALPSAPDGATFEVS